ncbi:MAG: nucleotidyl transferase AbiEii/AbiGii toxin family protein [Chloroflexi bacterium]|nr:nucleotidyl transferase AbiEii/AbiGii toxin family protein [Chloroflexota bacterium]
MTRPLKNRAASVKKRLVDLAHARNEDAQFVLTRYAAERFLYRLGKSPHRKGLVLKGAMLYALWGGPAYRPTRDLDFTGYGKSDVAAVLERFREILAVAVEDDGLAFDAASLRAAPIRDEAEYGGLRVTFMVMLGKAKIPMQVDVGFGNAIEPGARDEEYPVLLDAPKPTILAYPREAVVAEKFHAMVLLGGANSRYKDFYDVFVLSGQFLFDGASLTGAVAATFKRRRTAIGAETPAALTAAFYEDGERARQWRAYLVRGKLPGAPADFGPVGESVRGFLVAPWEALGSGAAFTMRWPPKGPWKSGAKESDA